MSTPTLSFSNIEKVIKNPDGSLSYRVKGNDIVYKAKTDTPAQMALLKAVEAAQVLRERAEKAQAEKNAAELAKGAEKKEVAPEKDEGEAKPSLLKRLWAFSRFVRPSFWGDKASEFKSRITKKKDAPSPEDPFLKAATRTKTEVPTQPSEQKPAVEVKQTQGVPQQQPAKEKADRNPPKAVATPAATASAPKVGTAEVAKETPAKQAPAAEAQSKPIDGPAVKEETLLQAIRETDKQFIIVMGDGYELAVDKNSPDAAPFAKAAAEVKKLTELYRDVSLDLTSSITEKLKAAEIQQERKVSEGQLIRLTSGTGASRYGIELPTGSWQALNLSPDESSYLDKQSELGRASVSLSSDDIIKLETLQLKKDAPFIRLESLLKQGKEVTQPAAAAPAKNVENINAELASAVTEADAHGAPGEDISFEALEAQDSAPKSTPQTVPVSDPVPAKPAVESQPASPVPAATKATAPASVTPTPAETAPSAPEAKQEAPVASEKTQTELAPVPAKEVPPADTQKVATETLTPATAPLPEPAPTVELEKGFLLSRSNNGKNVYSVGVSGGVYTLSLSKEQIESLEKFTAKDPIYHVYVQPGLSEIKIAGFIQHSQYEAGEIDNPTPVATVLGSEMTAPREVDEKIQVQWQRESAAIGVRPVFKKLDRPNAFSDYSKEPDIATP